MTTVHRVSTLALAATLLGTGAAHAQDPRLLHRLDSTTLAAVGAVMDSARTAGLPVEPLVQRALEGAAKHAEPDRIVAAVRRLTGELGLARAALGRESSPAELDAGASALRAGVRVEDLTLLRQRRAHTLTVALAALTDLVVGGVPPDSAASAVLALASRARDDQIADFRRAVERDIALGATPAAAAAVRVDATLRDVTGAAAQNPNAPRKP
ncbi:MAG TPA: hypothetical protein VKB63_15205 [Gemmatimonadales bacterium]|nr:hypothetical protein [Gemmatimonadales bacterium]